MKKIFIVRSNFPPLKNKLALGIFATYEEAETFRQKAIKNYKIEDQSLVFIVEETIKK